MRQGYTGRPNLVDLGHVIPEDRMGTKVPFADIIIIAWNSIILV